MAGVNKVILIGNLGRDPELSHTQKGTPVCRLNVATTRSWFNKDTNARTEETEWHRVSVWGAQAESCNKYLSKGRSIYVEGRLRTSKYEKNGEARYSTEIVAENVQFLSGKEGGPQKDEGPAQEPSAGGRFDPDPSDDLPF